MTSNQIAYTKTLEDARHNQVYERETNRHNRVGEGIERGKLGETTRHNYMTEGLTGQQIELDYARLAETKRNNITNEGIGLLNAGSNRMNAKANVSNAATNVRNASTKAFSAVEQAVRWENQNRNDTFNAISNGFGKVLDVVKLK